MSWQIAPGSLMTRWGREVQPGSAWQEYPRPQMTRPEWLNLNGLWDYAIASVDQESAPDFSGQILVPFPIESALSGVKRPLQPDERLWYRRSFSLPETWRGKRVLLHFGAVDWQADVWVNGNPVGSHQGGYAPFYFDISELLRDGENELLVSVWDPTDAHWQPRGKQVLAPKSIWYTAVSGIWQTVWLEPVPEAYISRLKLTPDLDRSILRVEAFLAGGSLSASIVEVKAFDAGQQVATAQAKLGEQALTLVIPNLKPWSPASPHLYDLTVAIPGDQVGSYFAMRKFSLGPDKQGHMRLCLNNQPLFNYGPLDQGYWPDGLYTPPSDTAMRWDLAFIKAMGCNMLRKHVKVEPARYYYYCDQLGLIVWQDMPNGAKPVGDLTSLNAILFGRHRRDDRKFEYAGRADPVSREEFRAELQEMVDHLYNFPCIGVWVPFNEGWGQFEAKATAEWLEQLDPTRRVDHASGWFDQRAGDFKSLHVYFKALPRLKPEHGRAMIISEFGGYSLKIEDHLWNPQAQFGYRKFKTTAELTGAYLRLLRKELQPLLADGLSAAIYTQTTDVEIEINGYLTYDREVVKMDIEQITQIHKELIEQ
jgi:beta-galactosidase/beta-glucuronidase